MTQQEWDSASDEERNAEIAKCYDEPWYYYNTYFKRPGDREYSKEDWQNIQGFIQTGGRRIRRKFDPIVLNNKIEWKKPKTSTSAYDGGAITRYVEDYDDAFYIPAQLAIDNPELYAKLVEQRRKAVSIVSKRMAETLNMDGIKGKAIFSTVEPLESPTLWFDSPTNESGLKRFFVPAYSKPCDEWGIPNEDKPMDI